MPRILGFPQYYISTIEFIVICYPTLISNSVASDIDSEIVGAVGAVEDVRHVRDVRDVRDAEQVETIGKSSDTISALKILINYLTDKGIIPNDPARCPYDVLSGYEYQDTSYRIGDKIYAVVEVVDNDMSFII